MPRKPEAEPRCEVLDAPQEVSQLASELGLSVLRHVYHQTELWMVLRRGQEIGSWVPATGSYRAGSVMGKSGNWVEVLQVMATHGRST